MPHPMELTFRKDRCYPRMIFAWEIPDHDELLSQGYLAQIAQRKWRELGFDEVEVWVREDGEICSNLKNGLPPRSTP